MRSKSGSVAAAVLLVALLAGPVCAAGTQDDDAQRIVAVEFVCAAPIDEGALRNLLPFRPGDLLVPDDLGQARWLLEQTEIFSTVTVDTEPRADGVAVLIHLVRKPVVNTIAFRGNHALSDDQLFRVIRLRESMALTDKLLDHAVQRLQHRYVDEGFANVTVTPEVRTRAPGEVDVVFRIVEGQPVRIVSIDIDGLQAVPMEEAKDALKIEAGDRYTRAGQRKAEQALLRFLRARQYYEATVDGSWERGGADWGFLRFTVDLGPPFRVEFSGNQAFSDSDLLGLMDLPKRAVITDGTWRELARRARRAYQEKGYYFARVDVDITPARGGAPKTVRFGIKEGEVYHVRAVDFVGNETLPAGVLREQMATQPPSWIPWKRGVLLDDVFDDDLKRLWYFYRRNGFEGAEIVDARRSFDAAAGEVTLTVVIEEGLRTFVRSIEPVGTQAINGRLPDFKTRIGEPLDPDTVEADRQALAEALGRAGYTNAEVKAEITSSRLGPHFAAAVRFIAQPGAEQRVGQIIVQNDIDTQWRVLLRELPFHKGDPVDPQALLRGQNNIYRLGLFRSVTVRSLETGSEPGVQDIGVSVSERPPGSIQWGLGYNTRDGFTSFGEIYYNNFRGLGERLGLHGEFSLDAHSWKPDDYIVNLSHFAPRLQDSWWNLRTNLIAQRSTRSVDQFSIERLAAIPAIERRLFPDVIEKELLARLEFQAEGAQVFNVAPDVLAFNPRDAGPLTTISFALYGIYDGRDDPFIPTRGIFDSFTVRWAPQQLGSDVPFVMLLGQHAQYIPLPHDMTLLYSVRAGWQKAIEAGEQVPIRYRFFVGGRTTVRGFSENSIGPTGLKGDPTGGDILVDLNTELRHPLVFGILGALFVDGGTVYLQNCPSSTVLNCPITFANLREGAGPGLRYITPIGSIGLDYGFKLDRRPGESIGEVSFSIGNIF
jgi:outer membrane protein insertion porin family